SGRTPVQRQSYNVLRLAVWRCVSVRAVSFAQRERAAAEIYGHLASLGPAQRSAHHNRPRSASLLGLQSCRYVHSMPRLGLPGRKHARDAVKCAWKKEVPLQLRYLERIALGTPYPEVVERLVQVTRWPELAGRCRLAVDGTGV